MDHISLFSPEGEDTYIQEKNSKDSIAIIILDITKVIMKCLLESFTP